MRSPLQSAISDGERPIRLRDADIQAQLSHAKTIEVKGYRGATRLSDGTLLAEHKGIAQERAEEIAEMFRGAGLEKVKFVVSADETAKEGGPEDRRVEIRVVP